LFAFKFIKEIIFVILDQISKFANYDQSKVLLR